jgi:4-amino-4-deoxy-L-arabinose transferase-like glycosyltransferase
VHVDKQPELSVSRSITWPVWVRRISPAAAIAFLAPLGVYIASLPPDVSLWDTAEMQTVPYIFGISHPTGFPTFVMAGWTFSHLVPFGNVAWRISLMSALAMSLAAWCVYACVVELEGKRALGTVCALLFAFGDVAWTRGTRAEVHSFAIAFAALTIWLVLRWRRTGDTQTLLIAALAYGFALATHGLVVLMAPGLAMLLFPRILSLPRKDLWHAAGHVIFPCLLYLYIPLRSMYLYAHQVDPTLALGIPPGRPFWDNHHPATPVAFWHYLTGGDSSQVGVGFSSMFSPGLYPEVVSRFGAAALHEFGFLALLFAALGFALLARDRWYTALGLALVCAPCIPYGLLYPEADPERYLLTAFWLIAVLAGIGLSRVIAAYLNRTDILVDALALAVGLALAASQFAVNAQTFNQRRDTGPREMIDKTVAQTPDNAILVANWAYATALGYGAYVDRRLGHRIVVVGFSGDYRPMYDTWLLTRPIYLVNENPFTDPLLDTKRISQDPQIIEVLKRGSR